jgi:hypothetical protein
LSLAVAFLDDEHCASTHGLFETNVAMLKATNGRAPGACI